MMDTHYHRAADVQQAACMARGREEAVIVEFVKPRHQPRIWLGFGGKYVEESLEGWHRQGCSVIGFPPTHVCKALLYRLANLLGLNVAKVTKDRGENVA